MIFIYDKYKFTYKQHPAEPMLNKKASVDLELKAPNEPGKLILNILQTNINLCRWEVCEVGWVIFIYHIHLLHWVFLMKSSLCPSL